MRLIVDNLTFGFDSDAPVLKDVSLTLDGPGLVCIIGPNGVGKSTLIRCINRLITPQSGTITIDGTDVRDLNRKQLSRLVSYVPAFSNGVFSVPVIESMLLAMEGGGSQADKIHRAGAILDLVGMGDFAMRRTNELSAGQHQKVSIARGLAQGTGIILMDEPTSNLDLKHQVYVMEMLHEVSRRKGLMTIMISHDINMAAKYADTVVVMQEPGVVSRIGPPEEVITEDLVREVYGVDCSVMELDGRPHIVIGNIPD